MSNKKNFRFVGGPLDGQFKELHPNLHEWFYQPPQDKPNETESEPETRSLFLAVSPQYRYVKEVVHGEEIFRFGEMIE